MSFSAAQWARLKQNFGPAQTLAEALATLNVTPAALVAALEAIVDLQSGVGGLGTRVVPPGAIEAFAGDTVPEGWLECDGALYYEKDYPDLAAALRGIWGGVEGADGPQFYVPDLRGEFIRGWDHARGIDMGRNLGAGQLDSIAPHLHEIPVVAGASGAGDANVIKPSTLFWDVTLKGHPATGETRPRNVALMYIIKT